MSEILCEDIEKLLDEKVRPDLALHGGNIRILRIESNIIHVQMTGQCSGCPSAELTMESLVSTELKQAFPQIKQVVMGTGVSDDLIMEAKAILQRRHSL